MTCVLCRRTVQYTQLIQRPLVRTAGDWKIVDSGFLTVLVITRGSNEIVNAKFK